MPPCERGVVALRGLDRERPFRLLPPVGCAVCLRSICIEKEANSSCSALIWLRICAAPEVQSPCAAGARARGADFARRASGRISADISSACEWVFPREKRRVSLRARVWRAGGEPGCTAAGVRGAEPDANPAPADWDSISSTVHDTNCMSKQVP